MIPDLIENLAMVRNVSHYVVNDQFFNRRVVFISQYTEKTRCKDIFVIEIFELISLRPLRKF